MAKKTVLMQTDYGRAVCEVLAAQVTWLVVQPGKTKGLVTIDDLRGSAELQQTPDTVIVVRRDRVNKSDTTRLVVEKCRFEGGREGIAVLGFDREAQSYHTIVPHSMTDEPPPEDEPPETVIQ